MRERESVNGTELRKTQRGSQETQQLTQGHWRTNPAIARAMEGAVPKEPEQPPKPNPTQRDGFVQNQQDEVQTPAPLLKQPTSDPGLPKEQLKAGPQQEQRCRKQRHGHCLRIPNQAQPRPNLGRTRIPLAESRPGESLNALATDGCCQPGRH